MEVELQQEADRGEQTHRYRLVHRSQERPESVWLPSYTQTQLQQAQGSLTGQE